MPCQVGSRNICESRRQHVKLKPAEQRAAACVSCHRVQERRRLRQGATKYESQVPGPERATRSASQRVQLAIQRSSSRRRLLLLCFSALLAQPPISPRTACPTRTGRVQWTTRRSSDRKRARSSSRVEERLDCRERTQCGFGVLHEIGESPQKIGWWGAKREGGKKRSLTLSAFNRPQFTHMHSKIFFTFTMKPRHTSMSRMSSHRRRLPLTRVEDGLCQLDMPKMPWTLRHPLTTRLTLEIAVYCAHPRIHETTQLGLVGRFVHDLRMFNFGDRVRFLLLVVRNASKGRKSGSKTYYLLWGEDTKLDLSHFADGCRRVCELVTKHGERQERGAEGVKSWRSPSGKDRDSPRYRDKQERGDEGRREGRDRRRRRGRGQGAGGLSQRSRRRDRSVTAVTRVTVTRLLAVAAGEAPVT